MTSETSKYQLFVFILENCKFLKMNEEIDEAEFYHQDFTTASEWEIFIARIEEIINQWKSEDTQTEILEMWNIKSENLSFIDFDFSMYLYRRNKCDDGDLQNEDQPKKNPFNSNFDFKLYDPESKSEHSILSNWYGIDEFIVISPTGNFGVNTESRIKILLSSVYVAASSTKCEIPMFVQIRDKWQHCYLGVYESECVRTNLEMVHLKTCPRLCQYLSGLLEMFRSKIVTSTINSVIAVSVQATYVLRDFGSFDWKQEYLIPDGENFDSANLSELPFGVTIDPIEAIVLKTSWSHLNHRSVRDCESYTDFEPMDAMKWSCLSTITDQPLCLLSECLSEFQHLVNNSATVYDVLGDFAVTPQTDVNNPLDLLTESKVPTISTLLTRAARTSLPKNKRGTAPLADEVLVPLLYFLFPDADLKSPDVYKDMENQSPQLPKDEDCFNIAHECRGFKTCAHDSLIWRLTVLLAHCLQSFGGAKAFSHLWFEFVQEMRFRWEKNVHIPGLLLGCPDLRTNLLHQKLQMLNCCIERKQSRENSTTCFDSAEGSSDEEFFDCAEEEEVKKKEKYSLWNQPVGRLGKFNELKLIKTGDPLYIPVTQEPVPKSEDQLEEDTDVLLKLGSDAQASELRAKMMSASLLSDMESFKAANPGSVLEDFIRWYSPRDWIEEEELDEWGQRKGQLSPRMTIEDNFWIQTWESAKPVPAHRQKRLFDDTREAEKVLHFLDSRNLSQICELLIPVLCHVAIYKLWDECQQVPVELPDSVERLRSLIKLGERISRENKWQPRRFDSFVQEVTALELKVAQINSLMYKFNPLGTVDENLSNLIARLVRGHEIEIVDKANSNLGNRIVAMFSDAQKAASMILPEQSSVDVKGNIFPQANEREIVMRVAVPRPATYSSECPQFLRAILNKNEFRLIGAFSEDIVFF